MNGAMDPEGPPMTVSDLLIAADHPSFAGHFPGFPIVPGAVLLDEVLHELVRSRGLDLALWQVATVKFLEIVRPGEGLELRHCARDGAAVRFAIRGASHQREVMAGTLTALAKRDDLHGD